MLLNLVYKHLYGPSEICSRVGIALLMNCRYTNRLNFVDFSDLIVACSWMVGSWLSIIRLWISRLRLCVMYVGTLFMCGSTLSYALR